MDETIIRWEQQDWLESAKTWIRAEMFRQNIAITGAIEQIHIRPWSTVLRVTTPDGLFFFKATAPYFGHETLLTNYLSQIEPLTAPKLVACDLDRHWLLMRDSGISLRTFIKSERSMKRWQEVIQKYVDLQKRTVKLKPDLLALGVMDRRLDRLPDLFNSLLSDENAMLLDQQDSLSTKDYRRLKTYAPQFRKLCEELSACGIPESLHHDDFHDGNIFLQSERVIFTDWGESAVTHPFFSLVVMLRSLENSLNLAPDAPAMQILRDWYLGEWKEYAPIGELQEISKLAERIGYVNRALTWHKVISHLPDTLKAHYAIAVPSYLMEFMNSENDLRD